MIYSKIFKISNDECGENSAVLLQTSYRILNFFCYKLSRHIHQLGISLHIPSKLGVVK
jgi:hypothetical protein